MQHGHRHVHARPVRLDELAHHFQIVPGFAARLEQGAVSAYLGAVPLFGTRDLAKAAARIGALVALCIGVAAHAAPDAVRGEQLYTRCIACHALAVDRVGPRHCALFGRLAGSVPAFPYSLAMKRSGITWHEQTLDRFLAKPLAMVPGSAMTYDGIADPVERKDLIAYLRRAQSTPECSAALPARR